MPLINDRLIIAHSYGNFLDLANLELCPAVSSGRAVKWRFLLLLLLLGVIRGVVEMEGVAEMAAHVALLLRKKGRGRSFWQMAEGGKRERGRRPPSRSHLLSRMDDIDKQEE